MTQSSELFPGMPSAKKTKAPPPIIPSKHGDARRRIAAELAERGCIYIYGGASSDERRFVREFTRADQGVFDLRGRNPEELEPGLVCVMPGAEPALEWCKSAMRRGFTTCDIDRVMLAKVSIRCLSLHEPWASLMAMGLKRYETRGWRPEVASGLIAIQAAKSTKEIGIIQSNPVYRRALADRQLNFGKILCVGQLDHAVPSEVWMRKIRPHLDKTDEVHFGNYAPGRFAWHVNNMRALPDPIPFSAQQGFFPLAQDAVDAITSQFPDLRNPS